MLKKIVFGFLIFGNVFLLVSAVSPPCNYVQNQGYSCNGIRSSIQYYYHVASRTCQSFVFLGCGGNGNRFPSRAACMQVCNRGNVPIGQGTRPGSINNNNNNIGQGVRPIGIGQGARPGPNSNNNIGHGTSPGSNNNNNNIGQGTQPISNNNNNIGQGTQPIEIGQGTNLSVRNNIVGNGVEISSMPSIGQGARGTSISNRGIGQGTNILTSTRNSNKTVDIFNPFHPGPVKTSNGSWPAPINPPTPNATKDFINGYAQMCDNIFGVNIQIPTSCGAKDSCPEGYQCAGTYCCPTKETVCSQNYESGHELKEQEHVGRYAYQPALKNCLKFSYYGSDGNYNNFKTYNDCMRYCGGGGS